MKGLWQIPNATQQAEIDFLIEAVRTEWGYRFESFQALPFHLDGVVLLGSPLRQSISIGFEKASSKVSVEWPVIMVNEEMIIVEGPVEGTFMNEGARVSLRNLIAFKATQFKRGDIATHTPLVKRLLCRVSLDGSDVPPSESCEKLFGSVALDLDATIIRDPQSLIIYDSCDEATRERLLEGDRNNFECELELRDCIQHAEVEAILRRRFQIALKGLSFFAGHGTALHNLPSGIRRLWLRSRQF